MSQMQMAVDRAVEHVVQGRPSADEALMELGWCAVYSTAAQPRAASCTLLASKYRSESEVLHREGPQ